MGRVPRFVRSLWFKVMFLSANVRQRWLERKTLLERVPTQPLARVLKNKAGAATKAKAKSKVAVLDMREWIVHCLATFPLSPEVESEFGVDCRVVTVFAISDSEREWPAHDGIDARNARGRNRSSRLRISLWR